MRIAVRFRPIVYLLLRGPIFFWGTLLLAAHRPADAAAGLLRLLGSQFGALRVLGGAALIEGRER